ncbi:chromate efflux transporter [Methylophaga sulfidovorans]|uniref:Chromate transporter n=1 Tax=Methylophaga sulfidovorans TaxID=45496 RepID=A0A1I4BP33_9GAMM|nr:chromate efflux transporter [Methylophaga sulfidovorans]SFK69957.1 chromate transporter [Methylophaga sulfidovorans]
MKLSLQADIFKAFFTLGLTAFGGPVAHIAYFRQAFVENRRWLSDEDFTQLLAVSQTLPGPASSQLGFAIGLYRGGILGAINAFLAFTLPSAIALILFAMYVVSISSPLKDAALHGLQLVALPVVADAVWKMSRQLCPDLNRRIIAGLSLLFLVLSPFSFSQFLIIGFGAIAGLYLLQPNTPGQPFSLNLPYSKKMAGLFLILFIILFFIPLLNIDQPLFHFITIFYQAGASVFGGGHVVLPLLENKMVSTGLISSEQFLAGYGAAQAVPGPLFTISAYLGALLPGESGGVTGAVISLCALFLPGFLLILALLPFWQSLQNNVVIQKALLGINAAMVGLLAAALYQPIWQHVIHSFTDIIIAITGFILLHVYRLSPVIIVLWCLAGSIITSLL